MFSKEGLRPFLLEGWICSTSQLHASVWAHKTTRRHHHLRTLSPLPADRFCTFLFVNFLAFLNHQPQKDPCHFNPWLAQLFKKLVKTAFKHEFSCERNHIFASDCFPSPQKIPKNTLKIKSSPCICTISEFGRLKAVKFLLTFFNTLSFLSPHAPVFPMFLSFKITEGF